MPLVGNFQPQITKPPQCANTEAVMIPHKDCAIPPRFGLYHSPLQNAPIFQERTDFYASIHDEKTKSWYCKFYYTDYTGTKKQKKKRGFKLQREAKEWERNFLET